MPFALAVLIGALLSVPALPASADPIPLQVSFELVSSSNPIDPRDWYVASFSYDPDTNRLVYQLTQQLLAGAVGFSSSFVDSSGLPMVFSDVSASTSTDFGSYYSIAGAATLEGDASEASLLAGNWDLYATSSYTTWKGNIGPVPEPHAALPLALVAGALLAARSRRRHNSGS